MKSKMKKLITSLTIIAMLATAFAGCSQNNDTTENGGETSTAVADELIADATVQETGDCGDNATYTLYDNGTLIIEGSGKITKRFSYEYLIKNIVIKDGITEIGNRIFYDNRTVESVSLPDSVTELGEGCFSWCNFKTISLPKNITVIPKDAFSYNDALEEINIPEGVTLIDDDAFRCCNQLKSITLPNTLKTINYHAFDYSSGGGPESITIPSSVETIGWEAFSGWRKTTIIVEGKSSAPDTFDENWADTRANIVWKP